MNFKILSIKKMIIISCCLLFVAIIVFYTYLTFFWTLVDNEQTAKQFKNSFNNNILEFNNFAINILSNYGVKRIIIDIRGEKICEIINKWQKCYGDNNWSMYNGVLNDGLPVYNYIDSKEGVLEYEGVKKENYDYIYNFFKEYQIREINKGENGEYVDLKNILNGLRYYVSSSSTFNKDIGYPFIEKIDEHWYFYSQDWN